MFIIGPILRGPINQKQSASNYKSENKALQNSK
jgi:hypothetical protein